MFVEKKGALAKKSEGVLNDALNKKSYKIIPRFTKAGKEGLVVAVKHNTFQSVLDVTTTHLNTIIAVRVSSAGTCSIRLILGYGPQEDEKSEIREEFFQELELELRCCITSGDLPLIIGDFNAKIEPSPSSFQGNPVSENGRLCVIFSRSTRCSY